ncbi:MAG: hydrogenase [Microcoleaceae cyanobacterium]
MEPAHQNLLQQLTALSTRHFSLGDRLAQAAQQLQKTGKPLSEKMLGELVKYNRDFSQLQQQVVADDPSGSVEELSLKDLEKKVQDQVKPQQEQATYQNALSILEQVLTLEHREQKELPALEIAKAKARELQVTITQTSPLALPLEAEALVKGNHPLSALVTLVHYQDNLDDAQWLMLEEKIEADFGKPLAIAVSRGKVAPALAVRPKVDPQPLVTLTAPTPVRQTVVSSDIVILEEPTAAAPQDVIIVPSIELLKTPPTLDNKLDNKLDNRNIVFGNLALQGNAPRSGSLSAVGLKVLVHLQGLGDREFGAQEYAGTRGQGRRVEAFQISLFPPISGLNLQYQAHISGVGDTPMTPAGQLVGERGKGRQIEGFAIELTGPQATNYDVFYTAHVQNKGDVPVCTQGQYCGTRGQALRVEGMKVWIQPKP